jgi:hypothetical protein
MLTEKCPHCGSYNDPSSAECYFCKKELPNTGKRKKKQKPRAEKPVTVSFASPGQRRVNRPGCLMMYVFFLFLICVAIVLLMINASGRFLAVGLPPEYAKYTTFLTDPLADPNNANLAVLVTQVLPISIAVISLITGLGLFLLLRWARALAMLLQALCILAYLGFSYVLLSIYYNPQDIRVPFVIVFILTLTVIIASIFVFVWFFERRRLFI